MNFSIHITSDAINATKLHERNLNNDINYLLDIDIAILGADKFSYQNYTNSIRKEYQIYPDQLFYTGRKKVLAHFLSLKSIYKTKYFIHKYEQNARLNILDEWNKLDG